MIVERYAAKKSLAVTLALAIGLSLPGAAWSQTYGARVAVTPGAGARSGAVVSGARIGGTVVAGLSVGSLSASAAPVLSAPAAALAAAPAAAVPASIPVAARPVSAPAATASKPSAPSAAASGAARLDTLSRAAGESSAEAGDVDVLSSGRIFDGSQTPASDAGTIPSAVQGGRAGRSLHPSLAPSVAPAPTATQQRMLRSLYQVASVFAEQYAPLDMKKDRFQLDLKREYDKAKAAVLADPAMTTRGFQDLLAALVASMRDYHVSISFNSTESSKLPFQVAGAKGRYFLTHIDREKLPLEVFPFQMGDELVSFGGQPTAAAVQAIAARMTGNTAETDQRMAELFLTNRRRARGDKDIPQGAAELVIRREGKLYRMMMPWDYTPELVKEAAPRNAGLLEPEELAGAPAAAPVSAGFFSAAGRAFSAAVHPLVDLFSVMRAEDSDNAFMIGARKSFVPRLGEVLWQSDDDSHFDAYVFKAKDGRKMGYIRIAAYDGELKEVQEFAQVMAKFSAETEALVIDQVSNPGGNVFYLYALASHLTDKPLVTPKHRLIIGEAEAHQSAEFLLELARPAKSKTKKEKEAPNASGYPITVKFISLMARSALFILQQFNAGKRFTGLIHISGVDDIDPAPKAEERYTKPVVVLTNALDFSGGDFFPAIMQDNKRATIMGVRTAGAGGIVKPFAVNQFGVGRLSATTSLAQRPNGQPIENLGVTPDIPYELTVKDLRTGFAEYRLAILKALNGLLAPAR